MTVHCPLCLDEVDITPEVDEMHVGGNADSGFVFEVRYLKSEIHHKCPVEDDDDLAIIISLDDHR